MINISRFIAVQEAITSQVDELVRTMLREIRNYYRAGEQAMEYDTFRLLRKTWDKYYAPMETIDFEWSDIQEALHAAVASVEVRTINGGNASKYLNYDEYDNGLRLICSRRSEPLPRPNSGRSVHQLLLSEFPDV